jgi:heat shock protein HtpX
MIDFAAAAGENRKRSRLLVGCLFGLATAVGLALDASLGTMGPEGVPVVTALALGATAVGVWIANRSGDQLVMASLRATPLSADDPEHQQLQNIAHEVAVASGLPTPRVFVIADPAPNALATGRDPEHASIAVTSGLLEKLDRAQTQGVVAHEMAHIGNRDTRLGVLVAVLIGAIALLADLAWRGRFIAPGERRERGDSRRSSGIDALLPLLLLIAALAPLASRLVAFAISRQREYLADATAVELTRNPLALASALETIGSEPRPTRAGTRGTAHLFFVTPAPSWADAREGAVANLWATHPPIAERIRRLRAMAGEAPAPVGAQEAR